MFLRDAIKIVKKNKKTLVAIKLQSSNYRPALLLHMIFLDRSLLF